MPVRAPLPPTTSGRGPPATAGPTARSRPGRRRRRAGRPSRRAAVGAGPAGGGAQPRRARRRRRTRRAALAGGSVDDAGKPDVRGNSGTPPRPERDPTPAFPARRRPSRPAPSRADPSAARSTARGRDARPAPARHRGPARPLPTGCPPGRGTRPVHRAPSGRSARSRPARRRCRRDRAVREHRFTRTNESTRRRIASVPSGRGTPGRPAATRWAGSACTTGVCGPAGRRTVSPTRTTPAVTLPRSGTSATSGVVRQHHVGRVVRAVPDLEGDPASGRR